MHKTTFTESTISKILDVYLLRAFLHCLLLQIGHKYVERRLLVAESCGGLAPYLPVH